MAGNKWGNKYDAFYVALLTPVKDDGYTFDVEEFRKYIRNFVNFPGFIENKGGVIVLPEAGEPFTMDREEKQAIISAAMDEVGGKVPVFAGAGAKNTKEQVRDAKDAEALGVDGIFVMPPVGCCDLTQSWNKEAVPEVFLNVSKAIADAVDLPFIAHGAGPVDPYWGPSFPTSTVLRIVEEVPNFVAWKMMYNQRGLYDVSHALRQYEKDTGHHVGLFTAAGDQFYDAMMNDICDGSVSCFWNYSEDMMIELIKAWKKEDIAGMKAVWFDGGLYNLHKTILAKGDRFHTTFKTAAWLRGMISNPYLRAPMVPPFKSEIAAIKAALEKCGVPVISDEEIAKIEATLPR